MQNKGLVHENSHSWGTRVGGETSHSLLTWNAKGRAREHAGGRLGGGTRGLLTWTDEGWLLAALVSEAGKGDSGWTELFCKSKREGSMEEAAWPC